MRGATPDRDPRRLRVALACDQQLIAEAVAAALGGRGFDLTVESWPRSPREETVARRIADHHPDVALLLYDVDMSLRMTLATHLVRSWTGPWVVLTGAPPGPAWGGLLRAGAAAVGSPGLSLVDLDALIRRAAGGWTMAAEPSSAAYLEAWDRVQAEHDRIQDRLDSLAPRERDVLELLCEGARVVDIAHGWGLAEATVRAQVRAVLRKLGVSSQLAAVAQVRAVDRAGEPLPPA